VGAREVDTHDDCLNHSFPEAVFALERGDGGRQCRAIDHRQRIELKDMTSSFFVLSRSSGN
jgi:hypothetical protein